MESKSHPVEKRIILHLRENYSNGFPIRDHIISNIDTDTLEGVMEQKEIKTFDLFQALMDLLLEDPENSMVKAFVADNPDREVM